MLFCDSTNSQPYNIAAISTSTYLIKHIVIFDFLRIAQLYVTPTAEAAKLPSGRGIKLPHQAESEEITSVEARVTQYQLERASEEDKERRSRERAGGRVFQTAVWKPRVLLQSCETSV